MKVYFYMTTVLEHGGGFENSFIDIAKGLDSRTFDVEIVTMDESFTKRLGALLSLYFRKNLNKNPVHRESSQVINSKLNGIKYTKCKTLRQLKYKLKEADVVYSKNEIIEASILKFFIRYSQVPPIIFLCGTTLFYPDPQTKEFKIHNFIYTGKIYKYLTSGVSQFHLKNDNDLKIINKLHKNVSAIKVYNPFKFDELYDNANHNPFQLTNKNRYNIAWIGRLEHQKGIKDLLSIVEKINSSEFQSKIAWNIAGEGNEKATIKALAEKWDNVYYYGHVPHKQIPSLLKQCNLFITTSRAESFGNNIVEANAMNLPAIAYNIPGPQEIIVNNENGLLVDDINQFIEAIKSFVTSPNTSRDISTIVKKKFDSKVIYKYTADIITSFYKRVL